MSRNILHILAYTVVAVAENYRRVLFPAVVRGIEGAENIRFVIGAMKLLRSVSASVEDVVVTASVGDVSGISLMELSSLSGFWEQPAITAAASITANAAAVLFAVFFVFLYITICSCVIKN